MLMDITRPIFEHIVFEVRLDKLESFGGYQGALRFELVECLIRYGTISVMGHQESCGTHCHNDVISSCHGERDMRMCGIECPLYDGNEGGFIFGKALKWVL